MIDAHDRRAILAAIAAFIIVGLAGRCERDAEQEIFNQERGMALMSIYPYSADPPHGDQGEPGTRSCGVALRETKVGSAEAGQ